MSSAPSANWPLDSLMTSLANAGWGDLSGRANSGLRATLKGLEALLPHKTARGNGTVWQIAQRAGLSERWTRRCLAALEELGLIRWDRGTIVNSEPRPSYFVVRRGVLARLIKAARGEVSKRIQARRKAFKARLLKIRKATLPPHSGKKAHSRAAFNAAHTTLTVGTNGAHRRARHSQPSKDKNMRQVPPLKINPQLMPTHCRHFDSNEISVIYSCPDCRYIATPAAAIAEHDAMQLAAERELEQSQDPAPAIPPELQPLTGLSLVKAMLAKAKA